MTEQKKEYIIDALGEIEDSFIAEAAEYVKPRLTWKYWRELGAVAACVATVAVTAAAWEYLPIGRNAASQDTASAESKAYTENVAVPESALEQDGNAMITESTAAAEAVEDEAVQSEGKGEEKYDENGTKFEGAIEETAPGEGNTVTGDIGGGLNDKLYSQNIAWEVIYDSQENNANNSESKVEQSVGQQEGQAAGQQGQEKEQQSSQRVECWEYTEKPTIMESASLSEWLSAEQMFAKDRDIFLGTVTEKQIFHVTEGVNTYFTVLTVEIEDCIRGELAVGAECSVYLPVAACDYVIRDSSIAGDLTKLEVGSRAVFMPTTATEESGEGTGTVRLCYADFADYYFSEGMRTLFLETGEGVSYAEDVYEISGDGAVTLEDVTAYIRDMIAE